MQTARESFYPKEDILAEILKQARHAQPDFITFVGDGEPTLCRDLGWLIRRTKNEQGLSVAVITNGSLLYHEEVRYDLAKADVVVPSLDAGNERTYRAINRPHHSIDFQTMLQGQVDFRHQYSGQIWLEVMLVRGLNDTEEELLSIRQAVSMLKPDRVYMATPIRPPAESWVKPSRPEAILKAQHVLGHVMTVTDRELGDFGVGGLDNAKLAIIEIGSRHPLLLEQAVEIEEAFTDTGTVTQMLEAGELLEVEYNGETYLLPDRFVRGKSSSQNKDRTCK